jgi:hypothetical protein
MPYSDFTTRSWKILKSSTPCGRDTIVYFSGPADQVTVCCGKTPYGLGRYYPAEGRLGERVERKDEYTITIFPPNPKHQLEACFTDTAGGRIGGSWTAEDNTTGIQGG